MEMGIKKFLLQNSNLQAAAKTSGRVIRLRAVVIHENRVIAAITKKSAAQLANIHRRFYPARRFDIELAQLLQLAVLLFC